ncbi:sialidase-1 [Streptomyces sp. DvalAA-14]|nr:sialidase-1 [Streptomyces sp. DvalAA-14]
MQALPTAAGSALRALIETDTGSTVQMDTAATVNLGDNAWHQFTLERQGSTAQLSIVDDVNHVRHVSQTVPATAPLSGSLTGTKATGVDGVRLGSKPDGTKVLSGDIDEFRLYDHALGAAEIASVADGGDLAPTSGLSVRWSFDGKYIYSLPTDRAAASTPATPDHSGWCNSAQILNGGSLDPQGESGTGLRLAGTTGNAALVPYSPSLALAPEAVAPSAVPRRPGETSDFTVSLWFKYAATAASPDQVLLWAYGAGSAERQLWLRASPGNDGIYADVATGTSEARLLVKDSGSRVAFGDNSWHQLTLLRSGGSLTLSVTTAAGTVTSPPAALGDGALTAPDTFAVNGIRLGSKVDGTQPLTGSLDEVRVYRQALSAQDRALLATTTPPTDASPVLWLPFDLISASSYARM